MWATVTVDQKWTDTFKGYTDILYPNLIKLIKPKFNLKTKREMGSLRGRKQKRKTFKTILDVSQRSEEKVGQMYLKSFSNLNIYDSMLFTLVSD